MTNDQILDPYVDKIRKKGRPDILEERHMTLDDLVAVYRSHKSLRKSAKELKMSPTTLLKYLTYAEACGPVGRPTNPYPWKRADHHPLRDWIAKQDRPIPRSVARISELSGVPRKGVYKYLAQRRQAAVAYLKTLGDIRSLGGISLRDVAGRVIAAGMISQHEMDVDKFSLVVTLNVVLNFGGKATIRLPFSRYRELFQEVPDARK